MNMSTNTISFNGTFFTTNSQGKETKQVFTNDMDVILNLENNLKNGKITDISISENNSKEGKLLQGNCLLNDTLTIRALKSNESTDNDTLILTIIRTNKDKNERLTIENDSNIDQVLKERLSQFITEFFKTIAQAKINAQKALNQQVVDFVSSK